MENTAEPAFSTDGDVGVVDRFLAGLARRERLLWALVVAAAIGDTLTTGLGIQVGLAEGNPIVRSWIEGYGLAPLALAKAGIILAGLAVASVVDHPGKIVVPLGFALPWLVATASNLVLIATVLL